MNEYVFLKITSVLIAAFSQILLKKSANKTYDNKLREYLNVLVVVGYGLFFISSILSIIALKKITISFSSIIESLSYIIVPLLSYIFLKERINIKQLIGMIVIVLGILIFNISI